MTQKQPGNWSIGVSGSMEKGAHIWGADPQSVPFSTWVAGPSAAEADALSTALYVNPNLLNRFPNYAMAVFHQNTTLTQNELFRNSFAISSSN